MSRATIDDMEFGNLMFGNSRGEYLFPDRALASCEEWESLCKAADVCSGYGTPEHGGEWIFENDTFIIRPYWWGKEDAPEAELPNFHYKPTDFKIDWYKYAFRDSYMNQDLTAEQIKEIFAKCRESIRK